MLDGGRAQRMPDELATEEPLEIALGTDEGYRTVAVTMRTPGADEELAAGFLFAEGVVGAAADIRAIRRPIDPATGPLEGGIVVELRAGLRPDLAPLERSFYTTSACGVCGKASLKALLPPRLVRLAPGPAIGREVLLSLPEKLKRAQGVFQATGGLHAAALFDPAGSLLAVREDVGRHNALDKLLGWALLGGRLPLSRGLVLVSGRASWEIVQKCLMAEVPLVCAVSAPSSAAVSLARQFGITLVGFLRGGRYNVYAAPERLRLDGFPPRPRSTG